MQEPQNLSFLEKPLKDAFYLTREINQEEKPKTKYT